MQAGRATGAGVGGRVVQAGVAIDMARRAGRVVRSREVQQRARELMPAANRLLGAVRREWLGNASPGASDASGPQDTRRSKFLPGMTIRR